MGYKAIIFDLDGTIIDTETIWNQASRQLLEKRGIKLDAKTDKELFESIQGLALHKSCLLIKQTAQLSEPLEGLIKEASTIAHDLYKRHVRFIPGFIKFHNKLTRLQLKSGVATNASAETAELTDRIMGLRRFFGKHIYNVSHVNFANKPDPALYLYAAQQLCVNPSDCIAIEDSRHGVTAAKNAGMYCIGINTAKNRTALSGADIIVDSYQQINLSELTSPE
jgi:HAD superfamily hydrolase (TIGR01509 family)